MKSLTEIDVLTTHNSKIKMVDFKNLEFGKYISDHMFVCDFANGRWQLSHILPYADLPISPSALALHYGQTVFEGMKAFYMADGAINIFRIRKHYQRFVKSLERMCMAVVPEEIFKDGLRKLVHLDKAWVPSEPGTALYIRPFVFASEKRFGVKISEEYRFIIFTGPVPPVFSKPVKVKVERQYIRAAKGGTGSAKCGGNYGGSFFATKKAKEEGYDQVLWTDGRENKFIEEAGMMNVMFVIDDTLVTPELSDSILDGVTRDSLLVLGKSLGYKVAERPVSVEELSHGIRNGIITEAFGTGTAAIVSPISTIRIGSEDYNLPPYTDNSVMFQLKRKLDAIRYGLEDDIYNWNFVLD